MLKKKLLKIFISKFQVFHIRRHHAAITMQRYIRGWVKRSQYLQAKDRTLRLQVCFTGGPRLVRFLGSQQTVQLEDLH